MPRFLLRKYRPVAALAGWVRGEQDEVRWSGVIWGNLGDEGWSCDGFRVSCSPIRKDASSFEISSISRLSDLNQWSAELWSWRLWLGLCNLNTDIYTLASCEGLVWICLKTCSWFDQHAVVWVSSPLQEDTFSTRGSQNEKQTSFRYQSNSTFSCEWSLAFVSSRLVCSSRYNPYSTYLEYARPGYARQMQVTCML